MHPDEAVAWCRFRNVEFTPNAPLTDETRRLLLRDSMHVPSYFTVNLLSEYLRLVPSLCPPDDRMDRVRHRCCIYRPATHLIRRSMCLAL